MTSLVQPTYLWDFNHEQGKKSNVTQYRALGTVVTKMESCIKGSKRKENCSNGIFCSNLSQIHLSIGMEYEKELDGF